jgi:hypothetical protein
VQDILQRGKSGFSNSGTVGMRKSSRIRWIYGVLLKVLYINESIILVKV